MRKEVFAFVVAGSILASAASAQVADGLEIRFCPTAQVRTFPLESARDVQSLLLQNAAIINHGASPADITSVTLELLEDAAPIDTRRIADADLASVAAAGPMVQKSGMMKLLAFQFCGSALIAEGVTLAGPTLGFNQALLVAQQPFAYKGKRDGLRMRVHARIDNRDVEVTASLPIRSGTAKTRLNFPLHGAWFAAVGPTMHTAHRWALPEEFAYDIARLGNGNLSHRGTGAHFADYYAYGAAVLAAADGIVVAAVNDEPEDAGALRRPDDTDESYLARVQTCRARCCRKASGGSWATTS